MKQISFIYVYYNTPKELEESIKSIPVAVGKYSYEVIVIDNNSTKEARKEIASKTKFIKNKINKGFGKAVNQGVKKASGKFLVIINPDTIFHRNSVKNLVDYLSKNTDVGVIGPSMIDGKGKKLPTISGAPKLLDILFAFSFLNKLFPNNKFSRKYWLTKVPRNKTRNVDVLSGACLVMSKEVFNKVGGFDERFFMYFEESDLCMRIKKLGYEIVFFPNSQITHYVAGSNKNKARIEKYFNKSRFQFIKKYYGLVPALLVEFFLRSTTKNAIILFFILFISLFLNIYKLPEFTHFIGDQGRDFLAAREILVEWKIPLLGIPSSISWLHQGPLSIYLIALAMFFGGINILAPAILFAFIGVLTTFLLYKFTVSLFENSTLGLFVALFFVTSPLQVINSRMPYHTALIPFFAILFFWFLYLSFKNIKKYVFFLLLSFGLLLQTELSNAVLASALGIVWWVKRKDLQARSYLAGFIGLIIGIIPFVIHDFSHGFIQIGGLTLWTINRIRLFLGLADDSSRTISQIPQALERVFQQFTGMIFPESLVVFFIITGISILGASYYMLKMKRFESVMLLIWLCIPLLGFIVHTAPGVAYFPLLYPVVAIIFGMGFYVFTSKFRVSVCLFIIICLMNAFFLISNSFYLTTSSARNPLPPFFYNYGYAVSMQEEAVKRILTDAKGEEFEIKGGGYIATIGTGVDNYKFLALSHNANLVEDAHLIYKIYDNLTEVKEKEKIIYTGRFIVITKNEN